MLTSKQIAAVQEGCIILVHPPDPKNLIWRTFIFIMFVSVLKRSPCLSATDIGWDKMKLRWAPTTIFYIAFPAFVIVLLVMLQFTSFYRKEGAEEGGVCKGIILLLATQRATVTKLPEITWVTIVDKYVLMSCIFLFSLCLNVVLTSSSDFCSDTIDIIVWFFSC